LQAESGNAHTQKRLLFETKNGKKQTQKKYVKQIEYGVRITLKKSKRRRIGVVPENSTLQGTLPQKILPTSSLFGRTSAGSVGGLTKKSTT
jgi:hypothetical protein